MSPLRICCNGIRFLPASGRHSARRGVVRASFHSLTDGWIDQTPPCGQPHWVRGDVLDALILPISPSTCSGGTSPFHFLPTASLNDILLRCCASSTALLSGCDVNGHGKHAAGCECAVASNKARAAMTKRVCKADLCIDSVKCPLYPPQQRRSGLSSSESEHLIACTNEQQHDDDGGSLQLVRGRSLVSRTSVSI